MDNFQGSALNTIGPALILVVCTAYYFTRKKKPKEEIDEELLYARISSYKPEPLIDYSKIDNDNKDIEIHAPDESIPGCLNLAKVNYFDFLNSKEFRNVAEACIRKYGVGSCGPRGFYGTVDIHLTLEERLAQFLQVEEAVLYSYGFATISSAISAYCKKSSIIFSDEKISFAATQGFLASKSQLVYFKHNDTSDLEAKLKEYEKKEKQKKKIFSKFLIVEGIYGSTGTICPLPKLMELREKYKLRIFIDETISFGVLGKTGRGITEHFGVDRSDVDMIMGSLEGSLGSIGGFCVGASVIVEHQRLSSLGYCFSASLPPFLSQVAISALDIFEKDPSMFGNLKKQCLRVHRRLTDMEGYIVISDPISPLKVITTKEVDRRIETVNLIHNFCTSKNVHMINLDGYLKLNVNVAHTDTEVDKIITTLDDAIRVSSTK
ncbi:hypothetical protein FQR65_LT11079 [Abscondita terminalis]|nr:hypothetical protein FQR65_LT11079 [Abscondita terminalis]